MNALTSVNIPQAALLLSSINYPCPVTNKPVTIPAQTIIEVDLSNSIAYVDGIHVDIESHEYRLIHN